MATGNELGRDELRALRPTAFLQNGGCVDSAGQPRSDLHGNLATAACVTLEDGQAAPQEFLAVFESIKQCLAMAPAGPPENIEDTVVEAFSVAASLLGKPINPAIVDWVKEFVPFVQTANDSEAMMQHLGAVAKQYSLIMSLKNR